MSRLIRNCIYLGKNTLRDKTFFFWSILYPILMAIFFYTAFSGIVNQEFEPVDLGVSPDSYFVSIFEEIEILNVHEITEEEANEKLLSDEIYGYVDNDLNLTVKESGLNQTIIKQILDQIVQVGGLNVPVEQVDMMVDYTISNNQNADTLIIIFYTLIAMVSTYGVFTGIETVSLIQANLSEIGKRMNIAPLRKSDFIISGLVGGFIMNVISNTLLLLFMHFILKLNLFTEFKYSMLFILLGNLFGLSLGMMIGSSNKKSTNVKTLIAVAVTLFLSFLSGMMSPDIKIILDEKIPILAKVNPISVITDNLYKINLLGITDDIYEGLGAISIYIIVLNLISYGFLRRKSYDSI
ncbi:MAG: ABC transporter permease [Tissierella sp.]|nr:ABC transporter permease [Tissierella sp.]